MGSAIILDSRRSIYIKLQLLKVRLFSILLVISASNALAQNKDNYFAGIGVNSFGASISRDKSVLRHLDLGLGLNVNNADEVYYNIRTSLYIDVRPYFQRRKNLLFLPIDIGWSIYNGSQPKDDNMQRSGLYTSFGVGYAYLITKRGMGPFICLAMNGYTEEHHLTDANLAPAARNYSIYDGMVQLSVGFKF